MNRLDGTFNRGMDVGGSPFQKRLMAFSALHRFEGRTFGLLVWEACLEDAAMYCLRHGLKLDGQIEDLIR